MIYYLCPYTTDRHAEDIMSKGKRIAMTAVLTFLALLLAGLALAGNYFYTYSLTPRRGERAPGVPQDVSEDTARAASWRSGTEWLNGNGYDIWMESHDGLRLHAHRANQEGHLYAILAHGYTANGRSMSAFGRHFFSRGFSVLLPDMRGHGQSEGGYIGMGWHDRLDLLGWIGGIIAEDPEAEILLMGISMGGAAVMMTAGEPLPPNVKLVIEDCGYTSVWDEFSVQLKAQFGLPAFPLMQAASAVTKLRAGYWLSEADAMAQVAKCRIPILFIHGEEDGFVPFWMLSSLYEAASCVKEKLIVPGAGHGMASTADPGGYWSTVDAFVDRHMEPARGIPSL